MKESQYLPCGEGQEVGLTRRGWLQPWPRGALPPEGALALLHHVARGVSGHPLAAPLPAPSQIPLLSGEVGPDALQRGRPWDRGPTELPKPREGLPPHAAPAPRGDGTILAGRDRLGMRVLCLRSVTFLFFFSAPAPCSVRPEVGGRGRRRRPETHSFSSAEPLAVAGLLRGSHGGNRALVAQLPCWEGHGRRCSRKAHVRFGGTSCGRALRGEWARHARLRAGTGTALTCPQRGHSGVPGSQGCHPRPSLVSWPRVTPSCARAE